MYTYKEHYGADADNNRAQLITQAVIESDDTDRIKELISQEYEPGKEIYTISLTDQFNQDIEIEVFISDYFDEHEMECLDDHFTNSLS